MVEWQEERNVDMKGYLISIYVIFILKEGGIVL